ncbi:hypothetical protein PTKU46_01480 [Paraburkholderia terrae]
MPNVERIDTDRINRLERAALERHNIVVEKLNGIADRISRLESIVALVLVHVRMNRKPR